MVFKMIVIIDYDMGNLGSIKNMLHKVGCKDVVISGNVADLKKADKLILPGVGAFDQGVKNLKKLGLYTVLQQAASEEHKTIMGICLGMQLLGRKSEEGVLEGLGLIPFDSKRFLLGDEFKVPHMGWSDVKICKDDPIIDDMPLKGNRFYFVHSYYALCDNKNDILMTCEYGTEFTAAVSRDNIYGFQFHPEKSHKYGMELFENFVKA